VPKAAVSIRKLKLPGCSKVRPAGVSMSNGTAFSGSLGVAARVDDHVVLGEARNAGHHALHLLVARVGAREGALRAAHQAPQLGAIALEQPLVVEAGPLGER
jgi:hypothetical protein